MEIRLQRYEINTNIFCRQNSLTYNILATDIQTALPRHEKRLLLLDKATSW